MFKKSQTVKLTKEIQEEINNVETRVGNLIQKECIFVITKENKYGYEGYSRIFRPEDRKKMISKISDTIIGGFRQGWIKSRHEQNSEEFKDFIYDLYLGAIVDYFNSDVYLDEYGKPKRVFIHRVMAFKDGTILKALAIAFSGGFLIASIIAYIVRVYS